MNHRSVFRASRGRRLLVFSCLFVVVSVVAGCLSTWKFSRTSGKIQSIKVDACSMILDIDHKVKWGDTVTFANHAGKDVILVFPARTVTAADEDPATPDIEVTAKKGRKKRITMSDDWQVPPREDDHPIEIRILDPCQGGAKMIIQPKQTD